MELVVGFDSSLIQLMDIIEDCFRIHDQDQPKKNSLTQSSEQYGNGTHAIISRIPAAALVARFLPVLVQKDVYGHRTGTANPVFLCGVYCRWPLKPAAYACEGQVKVRMDVVHRADASALEMNRALTLQI